jgi:hypothetical protein
VARGNSGRAGLQEMVPDDMNRHTNLRPKDSFRTGSLAADESVSVRPTGVVVKDRTSPALAKKMGGELGLAIAGEDTFEVKATHARDALGGPEIGEVPDVQAGDIRACLRRVQVQAKQL